MNNIGLLCRDHNSRALAVFCSFLFAVVFCDINANNIG